MFGILKVIRPAGSKYPLDVALHPRQLGTTVINKTAMKLKT